MRVEATKKTVILPPPWEALSLVAEFLDPKSLALASCVCKSWREVMSADHLWLSHLLSNFPSAKQFLAGGATSPRELFAVLRSASLRRRRNPPPPRISLADLVFAVDVFRRGNETCLLSLAKRGSELTKTEVFHFEIEPGCPAAVECGADEMRVTWTVVMVGCRGALSMMEGVAKGRNVGSNAVWFSEELPKPECCCSQAAVAGGGGTLMAEVGLEFSSGGEGDGRRRRVERVRVGMMADLGCRYLGLDDALLYLQSFLLG